MTLPWNLPLMLGVCAGAVSVALAASVVWLLRITSAVPRNLPVRSGSLPPLLWGTGRVAEILGHFTLPLLPARLERMWTTQLRQAEFEHRVPVQQWLGVRVLYAVALGALTGAALMPIIASDAALAVCAAVGGFLLPGMWLHDVVATRRASMLRDLPAYLDLLTLAVEAGGSLTSAMRIAVEKAPPSILRRVFERVLSDVRSGRSRRDALASAAAHYEMISLTAVTNALIQAESSGMSLGSILRAQAEQRLNERFAAAEKLAMQAPVKMLGPLILCIFPCTFIVIGFPIAVRLMGGLNA